MNSSFVLASPAKLRSVLKLRSPVKQTNSSPNDEGIMNITDDVTSLHLDDLSACNESFQSKVDSEMNMSIGSMSFSSLGSSFHSSSTKFMDSVRQLKIRKVKPSFEIYGELLEESSGDLAREMQKEASEPGQDASNNSGNSTINSVESEFGNESSNLLQLNASRSIDFDHIWAGSQRVEVNLSPLQERKVVADEPKRTPLIYCSPLRKKRSVPRDNGPKTPRRHRHVRHRRTENEVDVTHHVRTYAPRSYVDPEVVLERCRSPRKSRREHKQAQLSEGSKAKAPIQIDQTTNLFQHERPSQLHCSISADASDLGRIGGGRIAVGRTEHFNFTVSSGRKPYANSSPRRAFNRSNNSSSSSWGDSSFGRLDLKCVESKKERDEEYQRNRVKFDFDPKNLKSVMAGKEKLGPAKGKAKLTMVKMNPKLQRSALPRDNNIVISDC